MRWSPTTAERAQEQHSDRTIVVQLIVAGRARPGGEDQQEDN
jgi:hypothetical protein